MSKRTTNLLGIIITIIAGTYFYITLCGTCITAVEGISSIETNEVVNANSTPIEVKEEIKNTN